MIWVLLGFIFAAGAVGGLVNALLTDHGLVKPQYAVDKKTFLPGFLGNMLIGGLAAAISWGLYGPFAGAFMLGGPAAQSLDLGLTLSGIVGAALVGVSGASWLSNQIDKSLLRASGSRMAVNHSDAEMANAFASAPPAKLLSMVMKGNAGDGATVNKP